MGSYRQRDGITAEIRLPEGLTVVSAPPQLISQKTCESVLGIPRRNYLESLPAFRASGGIVLSLGRLRLVDPSAFVAWLKSRGEEAEPANDDGEGDPDAALREMAAADGLRLAKGKP